MVLSDSDAITAGLWAPVAMHSNQAASTSALSQEAATVAGLYAGSSPTPALDQPVGEHISPPSGPSGPSGPFGASKPDLQSDKPKRKSWIDAIAAILTPIFGAASKVRAIAAVCIALIAIGAFLPGFQTIPPIDRDESRFSQATRQMVATSDYIDIRFQNEPRYQKPIGIYWLQSLAVHVYGAHDGQAPIWVYRTVSFIGAVMAALFVYWLALAFGAPPIAFAAAALVALTILLGAEARLAKTDAMLFAMIVLAQGVLARAFIMKRDSAIKPWHLFAFWTAAAVGILIKGPILPMVIGTTIVAACLIDKRVAWLRRLRPGYGVLWMAVLAVPWFIAIGIASSGEFFAQSIGVDLFEKIGQSRERPFVPPGVFAFGFFPGLGWPLAPLAFLAIPFAIKTWKDKGTRFLVAWIVPTWLIFELSATKLPHYILPIYPALAILAGRMIFYEKLPKGFWAGLAKFLFILVPVVAAFGMPAILYFYGDGIDPLGAALGVIGALILLIAYLLLLKSHARAALVATIAGTLTLYSGAFGFHVPAARTIWITPQLVSALDAVACENPELMTLGYNEPSLVLMTRTDLRMVTEPSDVALFLAQTSGDGECRAAFVDAPAMDGVIAGLEAAGITARLVARVEGININGGDLLNLHVLASGEAR